MEGKFATVLLLLLVLCVTLCNCQELDTDVRSLYKLLVAKLEKRSLMDNVLSLLTWDKQVNLPAMASSDRASQMALLSGIIHDMTVEGETASLLQLIEQQLLLGESDPSVAANPLASVEESSALSEYELRVVELAREDYEKAIRVPKELIERSGKHSNVAFDMWMEARKKKDFSVFAPALQEWINIKREMANAIKPGQSVLNTLMNEFESGSTEERVFELFESVKHEIVKIIERVKKSEKYGKIDKSKFSSELYTRAKQEELSKRLAAEIGYSFESGRLDASVHPFTSIHSRFDVRITTRYNNNLMESIVPTLHEAGHAIFEQNLNLQYKGLPITYMFHRFGLHESQSIFYERHLGKSEKYWEHYLPVVQQMFPNTPICDMTARQVYEALNIVEPTFIRVTSDELTYPLHVILRFEIERGLFNGSISVNDVPQVWNAKMKEYLGIVPEDPVEGCLQDIHWSMGYIGMFSNYVLGAMNAAHLAANMPNLQNNLNKKDFPAILKDLSAVHSRGAFDRTTDDLLRQVTGEPLNPQYYLNYLRSKYFDIYNIDDHTSK